MNKSDYFIEREKKRMDKVLDDDKTIALKLDKIYKKNFKEIENQIDIFLGRYAFKENISMLEARKLVNNLDLKEYATKAKEYVKNKDLSDKANREMSIYNLKLKVTRLEMLKKNISLELGRLGTIEEDELKKHLEDIAQNQVDHNANIFNMNNKTQKDLLKSSKEIINASYKEATFSDRIWANQRGLKADLDKLIDRTMLRGESPQKWAKELKRNLQDVRKNARFNAERLAITESHKVLNDINLMSIKESGYTAVKIISEPGACHICKPHNGQIVNLDDKRAIAGDKLPMWHPYCRCSFAAYELSYEDITDTFKNDNIEGFLKEADNITVDGTRYDVDGHNVEIKVSKHEIEIAKALHSKYKGELHLLPKINIPQGIKSPDILWDGETWDVKGVKGNSSNTIYNNLRKASKQAKNVVLDFVNDKFDMQIFYNELENIFANERYENLNKIIIRFEDNIRVFKRK